MLTLLKIRKSNNPVAKEDKTSGYNLTSDGRAYYIAEFQDSNNPFSPKREKMISQQFRDAENKKDPIWKAGDPSVIKAFVGKTIAGSIVTKTVEPYDVNGRTATTYTAVVLAHENVETVFKNANHPIVDVTTGEVSTAPAIDLSKTELDLKVK
jgi:hypothetical protein